MLKRSIVIFFIMIFLPVCVTAQSITLKAVRVGGNVEKTRLVFDLTAKPVYKVNVIDNQKMLVLLESTRPRVILRQLNISHTLIQSVSSERGAGGVLRVTLNFKDPVLVKSFIVPKNKTHMDRLVLDFSKQTPVKEQDERITELKDVIVAIDAGHGGTDPGAKGVRGTNEKTITFAIAKELQKLVDEQPGMRAVLTRSSDKYVSLRGRLDRARRAKADIFISIHADAFTNRGARGAGVFMLSKHGASSEAARWLARHQNSELLTGVSLRHKSQSARAVLINQAQTDTLNKSASLADALLSALGKLTMLHRNYVERAGFLVLKSPDIPSVLIETGFISNRGEEARLRSAPYQQQLAKTIFTGLKNYLMDHPPKSSVFVTINRGTKKYRVQPGDSLSLIAGRHHTQVAVLKSLNNLSSDVIHQDDLLRVPG